MDIDNMSTEELRDKLKYDTVKMLKTFKTLKEGEYYFIDQDQEDIVVYDDDEEEVSLSYDEAREFLESK